MVVWLLSARETVDGDKFSALAKSAMEARWFCTGAGERDETERQK